MVGKIKDRIIEAKVNYYLSAINKIWGKGGGLEFKEVRDSKARAPELKKKEEAERILKAIPKESVLWVFDQQGKEFTSPELAQKIEKSIGQGRELAMVLGGAYGLDEKIKEKAEEVIALSRLTFPHELAGLILVEQIYRAIAIIKRIPYHH